jgi:hypothetical protein
VIDTFNAADKRTVVAGDSADNIGKIRGFIIDRVLTGSKRCTSPVDERTPTSSSGVGFASVATR